MYCHLTLVQGATRPVTLKFKLKLETLFAEEKAAEDKDDKVAAGVVGGVLGGAVSGGVVSSLMSG